MGTIIIILIIGAAIYFISKRSSAPKPVQTESRPQQMRFEELTEDELSARQERFDGLMRGPNGTELTKCYNKIAQMYIPTKNGDFAGCFSGYLAYTDRAKKMSTVDNEVITLLNHDPEAYAVWYDTLYDQLLNSVYTSQNRKMASAAQAVISDVMQGDELLELCGAWEKIADPAYANSKNKFQLPNTTIKLDICEKDGRVTYTIKGAYSSLKTGLSLDPLIRKAEILIAIGSQYNEPGFRFAKEDVAKYPLPSLSKLSRAN